MSVIQSYVLPIVEKENFQELTRFDISAHGQALEFHLVNN